MGAGGGTCTAAGSGNINDTVNLPAGGSVTYTASCSIRRERNGDAEQHRDRGGSGRRHRSNAANNSATDSDTLSAQADLAITKTDGVHDGDAGRLGDLHDHGRPTPARAT